MGNEFNTEIEKTFTQAEVNHIISERLAKDRAKGSADLEKREMELRSRELAMNARELLAEKGLPKELADILKFSDNDTMNKSIESIEKIFNDNKSEASSNIKLVGFQPADSADVTTADLADFKLRKAMGLPEIRKE